MSWPPFLTGIGVWIWKTRYAENDDLSAIIAKAKENGLTHVLIKCLDGEHLHHVRQLRTLVPGLLKVGIKPIPWAYVRGDDAGKEAKLFASVAGEYGLSNIVVNAEVEFTSKGDTAVEYMDYLRQFLAFENIDKPLIGLSSYYLPKNHPNFPWNQFMSFSEYMLPQVYWYNKDPVKCLEKSLKQTLSYDKPRFVTGQAYSIMEDELDAFLGACYRKLLWGANLWRWGTMSRQMWAVTKLWSEAYQIRYRQSGESNANSQ